MQEVWIASTARKHKLSSGRIREALAGAEFVEMDGDMAIYVGTMHVAWRSNSGSSQMTATRASR